IAHWAVGWVTKVALTVSCENLMDMDILSKSDPLCALYINTSGSQWYEFGCAEIIMNCLNPKFAKKFIDYTLMLPAFCVQIVSSRQMSRPLLLKDKRPAGHETISSPHSQVKFTGCSYAVHRLLT
uniref:C2 domain-containing protein n=1 Tax=Monopterus albus TaxID=43700 RepID=A0A3Q3JV71_MONAL